MHIDSIERMAVQTLTSTENSVGLRLVLDF